MRIASLFAVLWMAPVVKGLATARRLLLAASLILPLLFASQTCDMINLLLVYKKLAATLTNDFQVIKAHAKLLLV